MVDEIDEEARLVLVSFDREKGERFVTVRANQSQITEDDREAIVQELRVIAREIESGIYRVLLQRCVGQV